MKILELKGTIAEMKNSLEGFNSRIQQVEEKKQSANLQTYQLRLSYLNNEIKEKKHEQKSQRTSGHYQVSVQFSRSVMSDSLRPHESQHARPPCPSPTAGVHSDSRPSSP